MITEKLKSSALMRILIPALMSTAHAAEAEKKESEKATDDWEIRAGVGIFHGSEVRGLDKVKTMPAPFFEVSWKEKVFFNPIDGLGINVYESENTHLGFSLGMDGGRQEKKHNRLRGLGDIGASTVFTTNMGYSFGPVNTFIQAQKHFSGSDGLTIDIGAEMMLPLDLLTGKMSIDDMDLLDEPGQLTALSFSISGLWADEKYNQAYWGIDSGQAQRSGYNTHEVGAGLYGWNASMGIMTPLSERWSMLFNVEYLKMSGKAADSPFINKPSDTSVGVIFSYDF